METKNNTKIMCNGPGEKRTKTKLTPDGFLEQQFITRNSLLTDLFENPHIKTIYNMFIALFLWLFLNTVAHDYIEKGEINLGFRLIIFCFGKLHLSLLLWLGFFGGACFSFTCFNFWAKIRIILQPKSKIIKLWDYLAIAVLLIYYVLSFEIAARSVRLFSLPIASSCIVVMEQTRLLMKIHAFIRSTAPRVLNHKTHSDQQLQLPGFSKFLYFLFAPTLIYRDEYPRTTKIRWDFVSMRALEVVGVIFYYSFIFERLLIPTYQNFGLRKYTVNEIILSFFENSIIGILICFCSFFLLLHSWQNLFAELLRFGDRQFYKDWWTCTNFSDYFKTWNVVVYNWLYTYIYKDMYEFVVPLNKIVAKLTVFFISAFVHEWILTYFLGFFFPALFLEYFIFGTFLSFVRFPKTALMNVLFLYGLAFGSGGLISLYSIEYYARNNAPILNSTVDKSFLPRFLTCDCFV